jgi:hypothetical protein
MAMTKEYPGYVLGLFGVALGLFVLACVLAASGWVLEDDRLTFAAMASFAVGAIAFLYSTRKARQEGARTALFVQGHSEATR